MQADSYLKIAVQSPNRREMSISQFKSRSPAVDPSSRVSIFFYGINYNEVFSLNMILQ